MILRGPARGKSARASGGEPCAHERLHRLERRIERFGLAAAGLRKIRPTAAATAHLRSHRTGQLAGLDARGLVRGHPHYQQHLGGRSEEHTSELQSQSNLVCRLLLEKKNKIATPHKFVNESISTAVSSRVSTAPTSLRRPGTQTQLSDSIRIHRAVSSTALP